METKRPTLLTTEEVAELLRHHPVTIMHWVHRNEIPHIRISHRLLYPLEEILEWLEERTHRPTGNGNLKAEPLPEGSGILDETKVVYTRKKPEQKTERKKGGNPNFKPLAPEIEKRIGEPLPAWLERQYRAGKTKAEMARELGVHAATVTRWLGQYGITKAA